MFFVVATWQMATPSKDWLMLKWEMNGMCGLLV